MGDEGRHLKTQREDTAPGFVHRETEVYVSLIAPTEPVGSGAGPECSSLWLLFVCASGGKRGGYVRDRYSRGYLQSEGTAVAPLDNSQTQNCHCQCPAVAPTEATITPAGPALITACIATEPAPKVNCVHPCV